MQGKARGFELPPVILAAAGIQGPFHRGEHRERGAFYLGSFCPNFSAGSAVKMPHARLVSVSTTFITHKKGSGFPLRRERRGGGWNGLLFGAAAGEKREIGGAQNSPEIAQPPAYAGGCAMGAIPGWKTRRRWQCAPCSALRRRDGRWRRLPAVDACRRRPIPFPNRR